MTRAAFTRCSRQLRKLRRCPHKRGSNPCNISAAKARKNPLPAEAGHCGKVFPVPPAKMAKLSHTLFTNLTLSFFIHSRSNNTAVTSLLLQQAGDIHPNPGPIRFFCPICTKQIRTNQPSIKCTNCNKWIHKNKCSPFKTLPCQNYTWTCSICNPPTTSGTANKNQNKTQIKILQININGLHKKHSEIQSFLSKHNIENSSNPRSSFPS